MRSRLTTTAFYIGSMLTLLAFFNFGVYGLFISDLPDKTQSTLTPAQQLLVDEAGQRLGHMLFWVDGAMFVLVAIVGYYLARKALGPIESVYTSQQQFIADAAHELRTPLAVIKTATQTVLADKPTKQALKELAQDSLEEVDALSRITDDLLFLANQDEQPVAKIEKIDLASLARSCINHMKHYAKSYDVTITANDSGRAYMQGSTDDMRRLLANLVQNAVTYNRPGGSVAISISTQASVIVLGVADTGIGIPDIDQPHVFERFYKVDASRTERHAGAGLGLTIVRKIVMKHHGTMTLASAPGAGTKITILFPALS